MRSAVVFSCLFLAQLVQCLVIPSVNNAQLDFGDIPGAAEEQSVDSTAFSVLTTSQDSFQEYALDFRLKIFEGDIPESRHMISLNGHDVLHSSMKENVELKSEIMTFNDNTIIEASWSSRYIDVKSEQTLSLIEFHIHAVNNSLVEKSGFSAIFSHHEHLKIQKVIRHNSQVVSNISYVIESSKTVLAMPSALKIDWILLSFCGFLVFTLTVFLGHRRMTFGCVQHAAYSEKRDGLHCKCCKYHQRISSCTDLEKDSVNGEGFSDEKESTIIEEGTSMQEELAAFRQATDFVDSIVAAQQARGCRYNGEESPPAYELCNDYK